MKEVVLLNSGGLDSALLAKLLHGDGHTVHSLHLALGALNDASTLAAAQVTADRYCVSHHVIDVGYGQTSNALWDSAAGVLVMHDDATQEQKDDPRFALSQYPVLAMVTTALGVGYATTLGVPVVYTGMSNELTEVSLAAFDEVCRAVNWNLPKPVIEIPWVGLSYEQEAKSAGADLADFAYTHSCFHDPACGTCGKCLLRSEAGL